MEGTRAPLEEPEPPSAFEAAPCTIRWLLNMCWSLFENRELGSRYGRCLEYVDLLTCLRSPLHFARQSQSTFFAVDIIAYICTILYYGIPGRSGKIVKIKGQQ